MKRRTIRLGSVGFPASAGLVTALATVVLMAATSAGGVWTNMAAPFPHPAYALGVVAEANGSIYAIGGANGYPRSPAC